MDQKEARARARSCGIFSKYINLPCAVASLMLAIHSLTVDRQDLFVINTLMTLFNLGLYLQNKSRFTELTNFADALALSERVEKVRELNPHR